MNSRTFIFLLITVGRSIAKQHRVHHHHNDHGYQTLLPVQDTTTPLSTPTALTTGTTTTTSSITLTKTIIVSQPTRGAPPTGSTFAIRDALQERELLVTYLQSEVVGDIEGFTLFSDIPDIENQQRYILNDKGNLIHVATGWVAHGDDLVGHRFENPKTPDDALSSPACICAVDPVTSQLTCSCGSATKVCMDTSSSSTTPCTEQDISDTWAEVSWYVFPDDPSVTTGISPTATPSPPPEDRQFLLESANSEYLLVVVDHTPFLVLEDSNSTTGLDVIFGIDDDGAWINVATGDIAASNPEFTTGPISFWSREDMARLGLKPSTCDVVDQSGSVGFHCNNRRFCATEWGLFYCYGTRPDDNVVHLYSGLEI
ncbi:hypothetical protein PFICI_03624 [Pestalotiopsis fici W106-1]|uniref:Uncharacterized protein n=1 Tax=Pestalotiopsis fici (strain W106-1 / CGMCC3.15140) TaxID=1229662 RepID=W3XHW9_PESFW|nr:uncharacterized protein PFICI_03624 [Pestalotiopsis fici W106-1]ETS85599.1 hypothetical protein PFICI_03624 [Pestalotiopsis fici W106-1]